MAPKQVQFHLESDVFATSSVGFLTVGLRSSFRCCSSWSISSEPSAIDDSPAVKWFSFPSFKDGTVWVLICKSVGNLNEGEGDRFHLGYVVGIPLWDLSSAQEERLANSFRLAISRGEMNPLLSLGCQLSQWVFNKKLRL